MVCKGILQTGWLLVVVVVLLGKLWVCWVVTQTFSRSSDHGPTGGTVGQALLAPDRRNVPLDSLTGLLDKTLPWLVEVDRTRRMT
jgi:hypothetical protein